MSGTPWKSRVGNPGMQLPWRRARHRRHRRTDTGTMRCLLGVAEAEVAEVAKQIKGAVKQGIGKAVGDSKLESEGNAHKIEGKVQNAIGGLKDALKGK
jgi:uncharacterized protein YjbJ (UPF0337 family)